MRKLSPLVASVLLLSCTLLLGNFPASAQSTHLTVTLDEVTLPFLNDTTLKPESSLFLGKFGRFLIRNSKAWGRLEVVGHNQVPKASDEARRQAGQRAQLVEEGLIEGGAPQFRLKSRGKIGIGGETGARVELRFTGVSDPETLQDGFEKLRKSSKETEHP